MSRPGAVPVAATRTEAASQAGMAHAAAHSAYVPRPSLSKTTAGLTSSTTFATSTTGADEAQRYADFAQTVPGRNHHGTTVPRLPALPRVGNGGGGDVTLMSPQPRVAPDEPTASRMHTAATTTTTTTALRPLATAATWSPTMPVIARAAPARHSTATGSVPARAARTTSAARTTANTPARAFLRNCHRLQNPADAFSLKGPVQDLPTHPVAGGGKRSARKAHRQAPLSEEERQALRQRMIRSFLPETLRAKNEQQQAEKRARQARRERHEQKKQRLAERAERERQRAAHRPSASLVSGGEPERAGPASAESSGSPSSGPFEEASSLPLADTFSDLSSLSSCTLPPSPSASSASSSHFLRDDESDVTVAYEETVEEKRARFEQEMLLFFDVMHTRRVAAACVLQRAFRSHRARRALHARQQLVYARLYTHQKAAALCLVGFLQSAVQSRRRQEALATRAARDLARSAQERQTLAAVKVLTRAVRRWLDARRERDRRRHILALDWDSRLDDFDRATLLIQRWWRLVRVEKAYWRRRHLEVAEAQRAQAARARLDQAATSLQRVVRGHLARQACHARAAEAREAARTLRRQQDAAADVLTHFLRECELRAQQRTRDARADAERAEEAAETIQQSWRLALQRRALEGVARQARTLHAAAATLQRAWRRYDAARERRYLRQLAQTAREERCRAEARQFRAALVVQSFARLVLAKAEVRRRKATAGRTVLSAFSTLQRVGRGFLARAWLGDLWAAEQHRQREAAAASAHFHAWCRHVLHAFVAAKSSFAESQRRGRARAAEKHLIRTRLAVALREDAAATRIQQAFRAHRAWQTTVATAAQLEQARLFIHACAVRIQQAWRRYKARQLLLSQATLQSRWQQKREVLEQVAWSLWLEQEAALCDAEEAGRASLLADEHDESACVHWWARHEWRRCQGLIGADDNEDEEPPPAAIASVYARVMRAQAEAEEQHWGALYD